MWRSCFGDEEQLILGIWDGTNKGCDCERTSFKKSALKAKLRMVVNI